MLLVNGTVKVNHVVNVSGKYQYMHYMQFLILFTFGFAKKLIAKQLRAHLRKKKAGMLSADKENVILSMFEARVHTPHLPQRQ